MGYLAHGTELKGSTRREKNSVCFKLSELFLSGIVVTQLNWTEKYQTTSTV